MGSKASVSVVVNAPSTEVSQEEQTQETIEDLIPTLEPEITGAPTLEGYEKYNEIVPVINKVANEMNFDSLILASIVLTESRGDTNAKRHEANRYNQINAAFEVNPKYKQHYEKLKQEGLVQNEEEYFQTMSSYDRGLTQIAPATAVAYTSFRGHPDELYNPETNLRVIIEFLRNRGFDDETDTGLQGALTANTIVNTNSRTGTPVEGHTERANDYYEELEKEFDLENKGIHCKKGSTVCVIKTARLDLAKSTLYGIFQKIAESKNKDISVIDEFFTKITVTDEGIIFETEFIADLEEVMNLFNERYFKIAKNERKTVPEYQKSLVDRIESTKNNENSFEIKVIELIEELKIDFSAKEIAEDFLMRIYSRKYFGYSKYDERDERLISENPRELMNPYNLQKGLEKLQFPDYKKVKLKNAASELYEISKSAETGPKIKNSEFFDVLRKYDISYAEFLELIKMTLAYGDGLKTEISKFNIKMGTFYGDLDVYSRSLNLENSKLIMFLGDAEQIFIYNSLLGFNYDAELAYIGRLQMLTNEERENYEKAKKIFKALSENGMDEFFDLLKSPKNNKKRILEDIISDKKIVNLLNELIELGVYNPKNQNILEHYLATFRDVVKANKIEDEDVKNLVKFFLRIQLFYGSNSERILDNGLVYDSIFSKDDSGSGMFEIARQSVTATPNTIEAYSEFMQIFKELVIEKIREDDQFKQRAFELYESMNLGEENVIFIDSGFKGTIPMLFAALHSIKHPNSKTGVYIYGVKQRSKQEGVIDWIDIIPHTYDEMLDVWKLEEAGRFMSNGGFNENGEPMTTNGRIVNRFFAEVNMNEAISKN